MLLTRSALILMLIATLGAAGCGGGSADFEYPEATKTTTKIETFRTTLQEYSTSGELTSGIDLLLSEVDTLSEEGVSNTAEIKAKLEELAKAGSPAQVKKLSQETLELLPATAASTPAPTT